jgi:hypothetical protein
MIDRGSHRHEDWRGGRRLFVASVDGKPVLVFNRSPEIRRLTVMMYVRHILSLGQAEDRLFERGIDISHATIRFWWNRFGPMFAWEIRKRRVDIASKTLPPIRVKVKVYGKILLLALDYQRPASFYARVGSKHENSQ